MLGHAINAHRNARYTRQRKVNGYEISFGKESAKSEKVHFQYQTLVLHHLLRSTYEPDRNSELANFAVGSGSTQPVLLRFRVTQTAAFRTGISSNSHNIHTCTQLQRHHHATHTRTTTTPTTPQPQNHNKILPFVQKRTGEWYFYQQPAQLQVGLVTAVCVLFLPYLWPTHRSNS